MHHLFIVVIQIGHFCISNYRGVWNDAINCSDERKYESIHIKTVSDNLVTSVGLHKVDVLPTGNW